MIASHPVFAVVTCDVACDRCVASAVASANRPRHVQDAPFRDRDSEAGCRARNFFARLLLLSTCGTKRVFDPSQLHVKPGEDRLEAARRDL